MTFRKLHGIRSFRLSTDAPGNSAAKYRSICWPIWQSTYRVQWDHCPCKIHLVYKSARFLTRFLLKYLDFQTGQYPNWKLSIQYQRKFIKVGWGRDWKRASFLAENVSTHLIKSIFSPSIFESWTWWNVFWKIHLSWDANARLSLWCISLFWMLSVKISLWNILWGLQRT